MKTHTFNFTVVLLFILIIVSTKLEADEMAHAESKAVLSTVSGFISAHSKEGFQKALFFENSQDEQEFNKKFTIDYYPPPSIHRATGDIHIVQHPANFSSGEYALLIPTINGHVPKTYRIKRIDEKIYKIIYSRHDLFAKDDSHLRSAVSNSLMTVIEKIDEW